MKLYICANTSTERHRINAQTCIYNLRERCGAAIAMSESDCLALYNNRAFAATPDDCDYIVGIGGDGTVLRAAQAAMRTGKPLVGVNNGRLGYLCALSLSDVVALTERTFEELVPMQHTLLTLKYGGKVCTALNDVVISKANPGVSSQMEALSGDTLLAQWRCDGVIVSTPTGSTAYNFSAGGPRLMNDVPCFAVTPICPHNVSTRSIVVSDSRPVTIQITESADPNGVICADGVQLGAVSGSVTIKKADATLTLLHNPRSL